MTIVKSIILGYFTQLISLRKFIYLQKLNKAVRQASEKYIGSYFAFVNYFINANAVADFMVVFVFVLD